jgi:hypothetical protein
MSRPKTRMTVALAMAVTGLSFTAVPASAQPAPESCHGQTVASFAKAFGGARNAAEVLPRRPARCPGGSEVGPGRLLPVT